MLDALGTSFVRFWRQTRDKNFIGFDKYRKHGSYHWDALEEDEDYKRKLDVILTHIEPHYDCLDLGCGDGAYLYAVGQRCRSVMGIDADYDAIRLARKKLAEHHMENCRCIQTALSQVSLSKLGRNALYHFVYAMDLIEHLPDPAELLRLSVSLVKPNGLVLIGTPLFIRHNLVSPYHVREFTRNEILNLVSEYFIVQEERILPGRRKDGNVYEEDYHLSLGVPRGR